MRHGASLIAALEGMSRPAFRIAKELTLNSRSGLTVRFLSKKLELPEEEIEYIIDVNHRIFFTDITKVKLVAEGPAVVKRISDGLENRGDVPSLMNLVKGLGPHEFRRLEEQIGIEKPGGKKAAAEELVSRGYQHPDSIVEYVASRGFSPAAREIFDIVWQTKPGVLPTAAIRSAAAGKSDYAVEQALLELFNGFALFEMFRFDSEDRLVRVAGILSELRQWRESSRSNGAAKFGLRQIKGKPDDVDVRGLDLSDRICRLVAAIAARPVRMRGDGELFREDRRRLEDLCGDDLEPSLQTCLWMAQGVGWLARVDNELRAGEPEQLIELDRVGRHHVLFDWLMTTGSENASRRRMATLLEELKPDAWYPVTDFVDYAQRQNLDGERPQIKNAGGHWHYVGSSGGNTERSLARSLEETFLWLGLVDRAQDASRGLFRLTPLGRAFISGGDRKSLSKQFPERQGEIIVQPNFDIVVPSQDMDPLLTVPLDQFAVRGSTGLATVYTLTKDSFTRAVQDGHDGDAFVKFLLEHNRGGSLPSNVLTTLDDWRGGMKRVRLRTVHVLESDDPLVMADLLHRRRFNKHFEQLDPHKTVAVARISKADLAKELEKEGFVVD
ncbi:MAG: helicase-associated domain-containing protein [Candidatus Hydrogenedentes bacterium]|nr:helicase-associated domain-containing protein [Candidatus Hydrogenedentota bacterium]